MAVADCSAAATVSCHAVRSAPALVCLSTGAAAAGLLHFYGTFSHPAVGRSRRIHPAAFCWARVIRSASARHVGFRLRVLRCWCGRLAPAAALSLPNDHSRLRRSGLFRLAGVLPFGLRLCVLPLAMALLPWPLACARRHFNPGWRPCFPVHSCPTLRRARLRGSSGFPTQPARFSIPTLRPEYHPATGCNLLIFSGISAAVNSRLQMDGLTISLSRQSEILAILPVDNGDNGDGIGGGFRRRSSRHPWRYWRR
jgi:hypothetical protein